MFNAGYKKEALAGLDRAVASYKGVYETAIKTTVKLHEIRLVAVEIIKGVEVFINALANTPKEFQKIISEIILNRQNFEKDVHNLEIESKNAEKVGGSVAAAGVAAGVGVAALGPTAAMAVATTFGVASTGTAIASLTGAVATNAALAWLGGGALAAGGAGMAGGSAFLALAGPVGWALGGVGLVAGSLLASGKNKEVAEKAEAQTKVVKGEENKLAQVKVKVDAVHKETGEINDKIKKSLTYFEGLQSRFLFPIKDYRKLNTSQKEQLKTLVNVTFSLSQKINEKIA